jgi:hypothetical protein
MPAVAWTIAIVVTLVIAFVGLATLSDHCGSDDDER